MTVITLVAFALPLLAQSGAAGTPPPRVTTKDIKNHVGAEVTACGRVVMYDCDASTGALALDLDTPHSTRDSISVQIPREHWAASLGNGITNQYVFAQVCARGTTRKAGPRYLVVVGGRDAIEIVSPPPRDTRQLDATAALSCAEGVRPPELVKEVKPSYTREGMTARREGSVYLEMVVQPDGSTGDIRVLVPLLPDFGLNDRAVMAVRQWRFKPATLGGRPLPVVVIVEMTFTLR